MWPPGTYLIAIWAEVPGLSNVLDLVENRIFDQSLFK